MSTYSRHAAHFSIAAGLIVLGASCSATEDKLPLNGDAGADSGAGPDGGGGTEATGSSSSNAHSNFTDTDEPAGTIESDTDSDTTASSSSEGDSNTHGTGTDDGAESTGPVSSSADDNTIDSGTSANQSDSGTRSNQADSGTCSNQSDSGTSANANQPDGSTSANQSDSGITDDGGTNATQSDGSTDLSGDADSGTDAGTGGDANPECLNADNCDFSVGLLASGTAECIFDTYVERVTQMECLVQCDSFTVQVDWTPPPNETATEATPALQINGTPIELPDTSRVQPRTGGTLSTLSQVSDPFNECGTPKFEVPSHDAPLTAELTLLVGDREVTCTNRHGKADDVTRGIRIVQQLQTECGWGVEIESDELRGDAQCGVPTRQDRISAVDLNAGLINPQLVDRDPSRAMVVAGADLPGVGPWQLTSYDGQQIQIALESPNDYACWEQAPPTPDGPWALACAEGIPQPVFPGSEEANCPVGCVLETRQRPWEGFSACFCEFDATWTEAVQHCRSAGLEMYDWTSSPCGGEYVFDQCGYPTDDVWHALPRLDGGTVLSCPTVPLPPIPDVCFATKNTYLGYNDVEDLSVYERSRVSSACGETKAFYCDLND